MWHQYPGRDAWVAAAVTALIASVLLSSPAAAFGSCGAGHPASHQWTYNQYSGEAGALYTYQPYLPDINNQRSIAHLYPFYGSNYFPFAEVGWYRGSGAGPYPYLATSSTYYSASQDTGGVYDERDYFNAPDATPVNYKILNTSYDNVAGKWIWTPYANDLVNPLYTPPDGLGWRVSMNWARGLSGGELSSVTTYRGMEMHVWTQPTHELLLPSDGQWHLWTQDLMTLNNDSTVTCNDPGFTFTYNTPFDNYVVTGTSP